MSVFLKKSAKSSLLQWSFYKVIACISVGAPITGGMWRWRILYFHGYIGFKEKTCVFRLERQGPLLLNHLSDPSVTRFPIDSGNSEGGSHTLCWLRQTALFLSRLMLHRRAKKDASFSHFPLPIIAELIPEVIRAWSSLGSNKAEFPSPLVFSQGWIVCGSEQQQRRGTF